MLSVFYLNNSNSNIINTQYCVSILSSKLGKTCTNLVEEEFNLNNKGCQATPSKVKG